MQSVEVKNRPPTSPKLPVIISHLRRSEIKMEFTLEKNEQLRYVDIELEGLKKSEPDSPTIIRKYKAGDWTSGVLLPKTIQVYALDR